MECECRYLKWSFGKSMKKSELRFGYVMKVSGKENHEMPYCLVRCRVENSLMLYEYMVM